MLVTNDFDELPQTGMQYLRYSAIKGEKIRFRDEKFRICPKWLNVPSIRLTLDHLTQIWADHDR